MSDASNSADDPAASASLDFFAGTVAGVASLLCGHPFDTIKVRLQCQSVAKIGRYSNAMHALRMILRDEKVAGLYKGVMSPMLGVAAVNSSVFGVYGMAMRIQLANPSASPTLFQIFMAGSASGVVTSFITCPIERLKILQQSYPPHLAQPSTFSLFVSLLRSPSGVRSLYRGMTATMLRDIGYGPYFLTYEAISRGWPGEMKTGRADLIEEVEAEGIETNWARLLCAGGAAGVVGWGVTFPLDVVKTRIQASERYLPPSSTCAITERIPHPHRTVYSTFVNSYRSEGIRVFSVGLGPTLLRSIPVNMVCFFVFEAVMSAFR